MQAEVNLESSDLLLTTNADAVQRTIVMTLGDIILRVVLFFIMCSLISILVTGISILCTEWILNNLGLE